MYLPTKIRQIIQISQPAIQYLRVVSEISARSFAETTCRKNFLTGENKSFCGLKQKKRREARLVPPVLYRSSDRQNLLYFSLRKNVMDTLYFSSLPFFLFVMLSDFSVSV